MSRSAAERLDDKRAEIRAELLGLVRAFEALGAELPSYTVWRDRSKPVPLPLPGVFALGVDGALSVERAETPAAEGQLAGLVEQVRDLVDKTVALERAERLRRSQARAAFRRRRQR